MKHLCIKMLVGLMMTLSTVSANATDNLYLVGDAVRWKWNPESSVMMNNKGNDVFQVSVYLKANEEFKFLTVPAWGNVEYRAESLVTYLQPSVPAKLIKGQGNPLKEEDFKFKVSKSANYDITCDLAKGSIVLTESAYQEKEINTPNLWIIGDETSVGWSITNGIKMERNATDPMKFSATVYLTNYVNSNKPEDSGFKFAINSQAGWGQAFYTKNPENEGKMIFDESSDTDIKWKVTEPGTYTINVDVDALTFSMEKKVLDIDENSESNQSVAGKYDVTLHRTFNSNAWNSLVLPFSLNAEQISKAFGSEVKVASYTGTKKNGDGTYTLLFNQLKQNEIKANEPVIIYGVTASSEGYTFNYVTVETGTPTKKADGFNFVGFGNKAKTEAGDWFVSSDNKLYKAKGGEEIKATRAVFRSSDTEASSAKALAFSLGGTTGISTIIQNSKDVNCPVYNLSGQRVARNYRGIVIINGKKIINK